MEMFECVLVQSLCKFEMVKPEDTTAHAGPRRYRDGW